MSMALIFALQASMVTPSDFDLARLPRHDLDDGRACGAAPGGDPATITVCGGRRGGGAYPLAQMDRIYGPRPWIAETGIAHNLTGNVHVESVEFPQGQVSNRAMATLKLGF